MTKTPCLSKTYLATTALCGALALFASPTFAQQRTYDIPAGDLGGALAAYETATGQKVRIEGVDIAGRTTQGAQGAQSSRQALESVLAGTKLTSCGEDGGVLIVSEARGCSASQSDIASVPGDVSELVVTATGVSHLADRTRTGTRMDADPMTLPLSVSTVSEELLQDQQALTFADAVANISGVDSGIEGSFAMRGFNANVMRNGNLGIDGRSNNLPIIAISRLEVVKGPEAIIAGTGAGYGGVVNIITKTPPSTPKAEVTSSVGSNGYYDVGFDVGGPLTSEGTIRARLVGSTQSTDHTEAGYDGSSTDYLAPSVTFRIPNWGTEFTAQYEYQDIRNAPDLLVITDKSKLTDDLPIYRFGPKDSGIEVESRTATFSLEQRITDDWSLAIRYSHDQQDRDTSTSSTFSFPFFVPPPSVMTLQFDGVSSTEVENTKLELRGRFDTGPIEHRLLASYDVSKGDYHVKQRIIGVYSTNLDTGVTLDRTADLGPIFGVPTGFNGGGFTPEETGILLLDQMTWGKLVVLAGVRNMTYEAQTATGPKLETFERTLPSLGVVYRISPTLSVYGNASKGFRPNQGFYTINGNTVPPEDAQQYEVGVKALLMDEKIAATMSVYSIDQRNVAVPDPVNNMPICLGQTLVCYITVKGMHSEGFELDVSGKILPRLEVRANYRYADTETDDLSVATGLYAQHQGSIWLTYDFGTDGVGWWAGGGLRARSARIDGSPTLPMADNPSQFRLDLSVGYDAPKWSATFGVKNVTDERLYSVSSGTFGNATVEQPREFIATIRYRFR